MFDFTSASSAQINVKKISADSFTPLLVLENLKAKVLLESAYQETGKERYSLLMLSSAFVVTKENSRYFLSQNDFKIDLSELDGSKKFLDWLEFFRDFAPNKPQEITDLPLPLGGMGYLGYEFFEEIEEITFTQGKIVDTPECAFIFGRDFLIFDHLYDEAYIISISYAKENEKFDSTANIERIYQSIQNLSHSHSKCQIYPASVISQDKKAYYAEAIKTIQKDIYAGNLLQCVPSQSMQIRADLPPLEAYRNLRHTNPSPYMFYFDFTNFKILGASPEVMVKVQDTTLTLRPIAGTRKRGENPAKDLILQNELLNDEKENAEHLMLVDLGRNDIGKVSLGGSVQVSEFKIIEKYSQVMHIVSEIKGTLDTKRFSSKDVIYATFPAGTVSGAPKLQAIKTLAMIEPHKRGIYGGLVGYFDKNGNLDSAIAIRTAIWQNGIYYLQAGGGIVYDSDIQSEYIETQNKMLALIKAITQNTNKSDEYTTA